MKTQDELYNEYIDLIHQMRENHQFSELEMEMDDLLDKCDAVWYAMDKETMNRVEEYLAKDAK